jgi:hypothetical protein
MKSATKTCVPWLTAADAAEYLGFGTGPLALRRLYDFRRRHRPKTHRLGSSLRFRQVDLDACIEVEPDVIAPALKAIAGGKR